MESYKIILIGDSFVGKTNFLTQYVNGKFTEEYNSTVGIEFKDKIIYINNKRKIRLQIWDSSGQERFKSMSIQVIKNSDAVILVYAINDINSFNSLDMWLSKLNDATDLSKKPIIIVGNKSDVNDRKITYEEGKKYAESKGYNFYETSAKSGDHIEEAFNDIFEQLYKTFEEEITGEKQYNAAGMAIEKGKKDKKKKCC